MLIAGYSRDEHYVYVKLIAGILGVNLGALIGILCVNGPLPHCHECDRSAPDILCANYATMIYLLVKCLIS
jgi:hypothetical protein